MCGLYGYSKGDKTLFNSDKFTILSMQNMTRGEDSTGLYFENQKQYKLFKDAVRADIFIAAEYQDIKHFVKSANVTIAIGHNRAKTVGAATLENAHPFIVKGDRTIVLAHNGTLKNHEFVKGKYDKIKTVKLDVDSQLFVNYFANYNDFDILKRYDGAAALLWKNVDTNDLYAYRDSERPLHYGYINDNIYISSEASALQVIGATRVTQFEERKVYTISGGIITNISEKIEKDLFVIPTTTRTTTTYTAKKNTSVYPAYTNKQLKAAWNKFKKNELKYTVSLNTYVKSSISKKENDNILIFKCQDSLSEMMIDIDNFYDVDFSKFVTEKQKTDKFLFIKTVIKNKSNTKDLDIVFENPINFKVGDLGTIEEDSDNPNLPIRFRPDGDGERRDGCIYCKGNPSIHFCNASSCKYSLQFTLDNDDEDKITQINVITYSNTNTANCTNMDCENGYDYVRETICPECLGVSNNIPSIKQEDTHEENEIGSKYEEFLDFVDNIFNNYKSELKSSTYESYEEFKMHTEDLTLSFKVVVNDIVELCDTLTSSEYKILTVEEMCNIDDYSEYFQKQLKYVTNEDN
jgi:predicted glutamine amidotransferase